MPRGPARPGHGLKSDGGVTETGHRRPRQGRPVLRTRAGVGPTGDARLRVRAPRRLGVVPPPPPPPPVLSHPGSAPGLPEALLTAPRTQRNNVTSQGDNLIINPRNVKISKNEKKGLSSWLPKLGRNRGTLQRVAATPRRRRTPVCHRGETGRGAHGSETRPVPRQPRRPLARTAHRPQRPRLQGRTGASPGRARRAAHGPRAPGSVGEARPRLSPTLLCGP